jgi:hypothetical protein
MEKEKKVTAYMRVGSYKQVGLITLTEAGKLLNKTKEDMKRFVEETGLKKYAENEYRYLLDEDEVLKYKK